MLWKEIESEIKLGALRDAFREIDCLSVIHAAANLSQGVRVYALSSCSETVMSHVRSDRNEVGGLLLGKVWQNDVHVQTPNEALTVLVEAVPSVDYHNSSVSLEMGTEIWSQINKRVSPERIVVGWYHSHPNLGAFFSGTDRRTQKAFFNNHYSLGWVIDPYRNEQKVFIGKDSEEYKPSILVINHGLEMEKGH